MLPLCSATTLKAGGLLLDAAGVEATGAVAGDAVTVTSVGSCATLTSADCGRFAMVADATRIVLGGPGAGQQRTLVVEIPEMPVDQVKVGDALVLAVVPGLMDGFITRPGYQIVLSRGGKLVLFSSNLTSIMSFPLPGLSAFGVSFKVSGTTCSSGGSCPERRQSVQVTRGTEMGAVTAGQTVTVGDLSVSAARLDSQYTSGGCDMAAVVDMAGFVVP